MSFTFDDYMKVNNQLKRCNRQVYEYKKGLYEKYLSDKFMGKFMDDNK